MSSCTITRSVLAYCSTAQHTRGIVYYDFLEVVTSTRDEPTVFLS